MSAVIDQTFDPELPVEWIRPNPDNPNEGDEDSLNSSIDELGFYGAVLVRQVDEYEFELIGGEHRWRDRIKRGLTTIPAIIAHNVDDDAAMKMLLNDNEVTRRGQNNVAKLNKVLRGLESTKGVAFPADVLTGLAKHEAERTKGVVPNRDENPKQFEREYGIVISCADEGMQEKIYNQLLELGIDPEILRAVSI